MRNLFGNLDSIELFFLACGVIGGTYVVLRIILMVVGSDILGLEHDFDMDHGDSDHSFQIFSIQGLCSFLFMFGMVGFALYWQNRLGFIVSFVGGTLSGLITIKLMGKLFSVFKQLESDGTIPNEHTIGCEGEVYLTIPKDGIGRVTVKVSERLREYDAISDQNQEIKTGEPVIVVSVQGNTLVVDKMKNGAWR